MADPTAPAAHVARRVGELEPFLAMEVMERAFALERAGRRIAHLEIGEPDFDPPAQALAATRAALDAGETRYTDSRGLDDLRHAIARDCQRRHGVAVAPERVIVTSGTSPAMLLVFSLLLDPGDEVILGAPHYPCYPNFIRFCGAQPVSVRTEPADGYRLDPDAVARAVTPRTRAIVVGSPANPTGAVQPPEVLEGLAALGLPLVSDEIYHGLVYDPVEVRSALALPGDHFVLDGFSKRYAMTGFRLGWAVVPEWALRPLQIMQQNLFISANHFVQRAGVAALEHGEETRSRMVATYRRRRERLVAGLRELGFGLPHTPEGAFYVLADARRFTDDSLAFAFHLLENAGVGATPGRDFGPGGEGKLRFCYAVADDTIELALERLAGVLR
ncbi:MAG: pyridoxal phosphate-dependent aminotransferase [Myxococcota bacterium]